MSYDRMPVVRNVDGQLVLDDPDAIAVGEMLDRRNLRIAAESATPIIRRLAARMIEKGLDPAEFVILLANVDDPNGRVIANQTMPGHDWDQYRDAGLTPIASGLVGRRYLEDFTAPFAPSASAALKAESGQVVLVINQGTAVVFHADEFALTDAVA